MLRGILLSVVLAFSTGPALAFDISEMSDDERAIFRAEIRDYLLENPEVLMEAIAVLEERNAAESAENDAAMLDRYSAAIFEDGYSYIGGNPEGDVTVVEFLDYRCGFCKRAFPAVEELIASDGNIKLIVKEFPILGEQSVLASQYAIAAKMVEGDAAYKSIHDALMLHKGGVNEGFLARTSRQLGLNHGAISVKMESDEVAEIIKTNRALAQALKIQGTPSFIMGDNFVRGFVELEQMRAIVEGIRAQRG